MKKITLSLAAAVTLAVLTACSPSTETSADVPESNTLGTPVTAETTIPVEEVNMSAEETALNFTGIRTEVDCGPSPVPFTTHDMRCTIREEGSNTVFGARIRMTVNPDSSYRVDVKVDETPKEEPAA